MRQNYLKMKAKQWWILDAYPLLPWEENARGWAGEDHRKRCGQATVKFLAFTREGSFKNA